MFTSGGKWSSDTKCGGKRSGGFIDVNGGVSKGGSLIVTHHEYPSSATQRGGHSTGGSVGAGGGSYSSQEQHIQQVSSSLGGNVLGGAYHSGRKDRDIDDGINYQVKGIVSQLQKYGFKDAKGIVLSDCALEDRDIGCSSVFVKTLTNTSFNLTIIDLSNNKLGLDAAEGIFWATRVDHNLPGHVQSINLSNNLLDDNCAEHIAYYLQRNVHPSLKRLDVSGNQFSEVGNKYFIQAAKNIQQPIKILTDTTVNGLLKQGALMFGSIEARQNIIKDWLKIGRDNGIDTKNVTVSKDIFNKVINGVKLGGNFLLGWAKCSIVPDDVTTFGKDLIVATASKNAGIVNTVIDVTTCFFETFDESASSAQGIQFMIDTGLVGQSELLESIE